MTAARGEERGDEDVFEFTVATVLPAAGEERDDLIDVGVVSCEAHGMSVDESDERARCLIDAVCVDHRWQLEPLFLRYIIQLTRNVRLADSVEEA